MGTGCGTTGVAAARCERSRGAGGKPGSWLTRRADDLFRAIVWSGGERSTPAESVEFAGSGDDSDRGSMDLQQRLMVDLKEAMRTGDGDRRDAIRMLRAALKNEEIELRRPLTYQEAEAVVTRMARRHRESIEQFRLAGRDDLVAHEEAQLAAVDPYVPRLMSTADIEDQVRAVIAEIDGDRPRAQGQIMGVLAQRLRGRADLKEVSEVVRRILAAQPAGG